MMFYVSKEIERKKKNNKENERKRMKVYGDN